MSQVFSTVRHGYSPEEVDSYILELQALIDERNSQLMAYRDREASINRSLISTQAIQQQTILDASQQARQIVADAQAQADLIRTDAQLQADRTRAAARKEMGDIADRIRLLRAELNDLSENMDGCMRRLGLEGTPSQESEPVDVASLYSKLS